MQYFVFETFSVSQVIHDNRITWLTENVSKTKYCIKHVENCLKSAYLI